MTMKRNEVSLADGGEETGWVHEFHGDVVPWVFFVPVDLLLDAHTVTVFVEPQVVCLPA